jgi:ribokinase
LTGQALGSVLVAGSANIDFVVRAPRIPAPGETVLGGDLTFVPGGKGANQAVACAKAGDAQVAMLAALGDDPFAPILRGSLAEAGVRLIEKRSDRPTGAALITVSDNAENAITVSSGANAALAAGDLPDLAGVDWLVLQLETSLATVTAFAQAARAVGVKVLLNAAPAQSLPATLLGAVDVLVLNEVELATVAGPGGSIAEQLTRTGATATVVTLGARGACACIDGDYVLQPAFAVTPVDTTAAGDTFCGVLAAGLAQELTMSQALARAAAASALATTQPGAQSSIPTQAEVDAFMATARRHNRDELALHCGVDALER